MMLCATRIRFRPWKNWQIRWFTRRYGVDLSEAAAPSPDHYSDFNQFFTRPLRPGARRWPEQMNVLCSPADGCLSSHGPVSDGSSLEAKGAPFSVDALLADDDEFTRRLSQGYQFTIYLAPRDYHRVHMPIHGELAAVHYVPGRLFSVNPRTVVRVPDLFSRNERVISRFQTDFGAMAVIMVGAVFVGAVEHASLGMVTPPRSDSVRAFPFDRSGTVPPAIPRAAELGRFHMGSTVIVLIEDPRRRFSGRGRVRRASKSGTR